LRRRQSVRYLGSVTRPPPSDLAALADRPYERRARGARRPPWGLEHPALAALLAVAAVGCKAKPKPSPASVVPSASVSVAPPASAAPEAAAHCKSLSENAALRVGEAGRTRAPAGDGDDEDEVDEAALPFATRVDAAVALDDAFAVGGLETRSGKTEAFVGWVPLGGGAGKRLGLGVVHGDVDPPLVAGRGKVLVVAVEDMDAGGGMLRVHRLDPASDKPSGEASFTGVEHDAGAALALDQRGAALVFGAKRAQGVVLKLALLDPGALTGSPAPRELEHTLHAESPALLTRAGGFWLAWISEQPALPRVDAGAPPDAAPPSDESDAPLVSSGPRVLLALPLDSGGKASGAPRAVSAEKGRVLGFEAAVMPDGALALAFREDESSPGGEHAPPDLARVTLDGAVERAKIEDEDLSAGLPALLADAHPGGRVWVALESASGGTRVGLLKTEPLGLESLVGDRLLRGAEVLAAGSGTLLVSRNRGRAVELGVVECKPSP
jgi:hypothetical protein